MHFFGQVTERRILSLVVMEIDRNLSSPSLPVEAIHVYLEDGLFDPYLPPRIRDKSTSQRCDSNLLHQLLCLLIGIDGMLVAEMIHFILYFFASRKQPYSYFQSFRKKKNFLSSLDTKRCNAFVAFYLIKYFIPF